MKTLFAGLLTAAAVMASVPAFAQKPIVIKFSHVVAPDTPKGIAIERFKKLAEERTGGRVEVEVYPNSQLYKDKEELEALQLGAVQMLAPTASKLYKDKEELEALQLGAVQMLAPTASKFGPIGLKEYQAFDLPYLFPDRASVRAMTEGPVGATMLGKLESKGMVGLAFWENGFRAVSANVSLRDPENLKGQKIRINSSKVNAETVKALGGLPQTMALSEVYQALQTGVVDGTDGPLSNFYTQKQHEVQKYVTLTDHSFSLYIAVVNKTFWDGLPADIRTELTGAMREATALNNRLAEEDERKTIDEIKAADKCEVQVLPPAEHKAWVTALTPVQTRMAKQLGLSDFVQSVHQQLAAAKPQ